MTVVRDDADVLAAWLAPSTPIFKTVLPDGRDLRALPLYDAFRADRALKRDVWRGGGILKVAPTGVPWSAWLFRNADGTFRNWYINLEDVHVRDDANVITQDHVLDVVVYPDGRVEWKDEDELEAAVAAGRYTAEDAARFEADAREVEELAAGWGSPFCDGWEDWRPDPAWAIPTLPADSVADY
ncbi:DUF402 domain-containing protein [Actinopolymorpha alba]|uniref:DUF402 domain-containing protein n=1 Tax=Actinopolymorpha alba TaxID=533267 RepID=UPI00037D477E|nr:DUF402 domain-containing protein [Actinopolymorpha alba]